MGGGGGSSGKSTVTNVPWEGQQGSLTKIYQGADAAYDATPKTAYSGEYVAGPDQQQLAARQSALDFANGGAQQITQPFIQNVADTASGKYLNPDTNPYLKQNADAITAMSNKNLHDTVLPQLNSAAIAGGAYGGSRAQIGAGKAVADQQLGLDSIIAKTYLDNYSAERGRMSDPGLISAGIQAGVAPSAIMNQVGTANQADADRAIQNELAKYQASINAPWLGLDKYAGIVGGAIPGTQTTQGQGAGTGANVLTGALGGAASGAALGSVVPGLGTAYGAAAGGILGGLSGFLSR